MRVIISIDPGSIRLGYAVFVDDVTGLVLRKSGVLIFLSSDVGVRLKEVFNFFVALVSDLRSFFDQATFCFIVERVFLGKGVENCFLLAAFYYHIFFISSYLYASCEDMLAVSVKKYLVGNGRASKEEVAKMVRVTFPCVGDGLYFDEYDAIALGYVYAMRPSFS